MKSIRMGSCRFLQAVRLGWVIGSLVFTSAAIAQQTFKSPEEAAEALIIAVRGDDQKEIVRLLGPGSLDILSSGDRVNDENLRKAFVAAFDVHHSIKKDGDKPATLMIGQDDYPFSIPISQHDGGWAFDIAAGRDELLARRIGRNELAAIKVCLAYFDAQNEYAAVTTVGHLPVYAQHLVSAPGTKNGLYWPAPNDEAASPLGEAVALASIAGYRVGKAEPFHGYFYKILTRQGANAPGGEHDYVVNGKMIGGFALIAWPARYGNSGIMSFMISHDGDVYEKDLGANTASLASQIAAFNPDHTWRKANTSE
jgi:hypothetical protein